MTLDTTIAIDITVAFGRSADVIACNELWRTPLEFQYTSNFLIM